MFYFRGSVANMLISCCKDNICRLWVETVVPEDGLVDLSDVSPASTSAMYNTQRHRNRLMQRLQHIRLAQAESSNCFSFYIFNK